MRQTRYLNVILTVNALLLAALLWTAIAGQPLLVNEASAQVRTRYSTPPTIPTATPTAAINIPSPSANFATRRGLQPTADNVPNCFIRWTRPRRNSIAINITAAAITKKLSERNKPSKGVVPRDAESCC